MGRWGLQSVGNVRKVKNLYTVRVLRRLTDLPFGLGLTAPRPLSVQAISPLSEVTGEGMSCCDNGELVGHNRVTLLVRRGSRTLRNSDF